MIWFWSVAALLVAAVLAGLLGPLIRRPRDEDGSAEMVATFRRASAELDADTAQGRLMPEGAAAAEAEITRRLLRAAARETAEPNLPTGSPAETSWRVGAAVGIAGLLPAAAIAIYLAVGTPFAIGGSTAANEAMQQHERAELTAAASVLAARTKSHPDNLEDWIMLGRTWASLQHFAEAREAYRHAMGLAPVRQELHAELGEVLVLEAQGVVTPAADAEFAKAGDDPRARYYTAEAALQHGDAAKAKSLLRALLATAPADAPWRRYVAQRLAEIAPGMAPAADGSTAPATTSSGPTAQDIAAAQAMSPERRQTMIRGMVARLAARLEAHPDDKQGWARLAHAYDVLGEPDKAQMARARAAAAASPPSPR